MDNRDEWLAKELDEERYGLNKRALDYVGSGLIKRDWSKEDKSFPDRSTGKTDNDVAESA